MSIVQMVLKIPLIGPDYSSIPNQKEIMHERTGFTLHRNQGTLLLH